jgi:hypothetical protein
LLKIRLESFPCYLPLYWHVAEVAKLLSEIADLSVKNNWIEKDIGNRKLQACSLQFKDIYLFIR